MIERSGGRLSEAAAWGRGIEIGSGMVSEGGVTVVAGATVIKKPTVLHLLGAFDLATGTDEVLTVPGGHARQLLQRLAAGAPSTVSADALMGELWGSTPPPTASRTLASLVSRLRALLGADVLTGSASVGYGLVIGPTLTTDLAQIEALCAEAHARLRDSPALTVSATQAALDGLARGPLLGGRRFDAEWFDELDRRVDTLRRRLQRLLWDGETRLGQWDQIIDRAGAVLTHDAYDEEATRALMTAHWHLGDRGSALHAHEVLRDHLRDQLSSEPSPETDDLYHKIVTTGPPGQLATEEGQTTGSPGSLVGRQTELATLIDLWGAANNDEPNLVVISGPLGSGRSRLAAEFADIVGRAGGQVHVCECYEAQHAAFLQPILEVLSRAVLAKPGSEIEALAGTVARYIGPPHP